MKFKADHGNCEDKQLKKLKKSMLTKFKSRSQVFGDDKSAVLKKSLPTDQSYIGDRTHDNMILKTDND